MDISIVRRWFLSSIITILYQDSAEKWPKEKYMNFTHYAVHVQNF